MKHNLLAGIPEEYCRLVQLPNERGHNAVWDFVASPEGRFFISICGENEMPLSALLYEYYPKSGKLRLIVDLEKAWIINQDEMPPSKIHTSIDFLPDGRLIMATHNTSPAPSHKQWLYEQHYEHTWEGYPGSIIMIVNPDTNDVNVRGIPVPRESIYGGVLGDNPRYYYFLGYMRGHFYRLDLETNEVKDYGKVSEFASCRLVKDPKGRIYGGTYTGGLWRYDPSKDEVEDLKARFLSPHGTKYRRAFIFGLTSPKGTLFLTNNVDGEMLELDPETLEVTRHGFVHLRPEQPRNPYLKQAIGGLAADENFVLYYGLETYHDAELVRLVRWDILNGGEPENLGLVSPEGKQSQYLCEMLFDNDGLLHMVDVCGLYSPYILTVDVKKLQPPGADAPMAVIKPYIEPDMHMNSNREYFMHIEAQKISTLPLHMHMEWKKTTVRHMRLMDDGRLYCITGRNSVCLIRFTDEGEKHESIEELYDDGAPLSCVDLQGSMVAVLTSDKKILIVDLIGKNKIKVISLPEEIKAFKLYCVIDGQRLILSDDEGCLYILDHMHNDVCLLKDVKVQSVDAHIIKLDHRQILLSGENDEIIKYNIYTKQLEVLEVRSSSIKGRAFKATITGGIVMEDGIIAAGTSDGMFFTITPDLKKVVNYGRLYSTGQLRDFIKYGNNSILGIYGGSKDAGHVFHFSPDSGFTDMGRPRVIKDNAQLVNIDSEWANIHCISRIVYDKAKDILWVASGEEYGCIIRYGRAVIPL